MKRKAKFVAGTLAVVMLAGGTFGGVVNAEEATYPAGPYYYMPKDVASVWNSYSASGAVRAGEEFGVEVVVAGPTTVDSTQQMNMLQDTILSEPTGIGIAVNDSAGTTPIINSGIADGVNIVTWDSDASDSDRVIYVNSQSDYQNGPDLVNILVETMGEEGKIALMVGGLSAGNTQERIKGCEDAIAENYPNIEIVTVAASDDDAQKAYQNAQNLISAYSEELTGIIGLGGNETSAAAQAVEDAVADGVIEEGQVSVTGLTLPSLIRPFIKSGTVAKAQATEAAELGYCTIWTLTQLADDRVFEDGEVVEIPGYEAPEEGYPKVVGDKLLIGILTLTADNVDDFDF